MRQPALRVPARVRWALESLNFFMADIQAGVGPFLGVFLLARGWQSGPIGSVMTIGGIAGMLITAPAGAWIDVTRRKRGFIAIAAVCTVLASAAILYSQEFWVVTASQVATAIAGAAMMPAVVGITLGLVDQAGFNLQNGRNQAFNHAGNMVGAAISGYFGWKYGLTAVFVLAAVFGILTIVSVVLIPGRLIDHRKARGLATDHGGQARGFRVLIECKPLLVLAASLAFFHLGNAAMLPLYGLAVVAAKQGNPATLVALTIVVAQGVMIVASIVAMRMAQTRGYWLVILITFIALPIRAVVAASVIKEWGVFPVQVLDGVGAGLQSVAVSGLVARLMDGTGRVNVAQGAVMAVQGVGASLSPAIGGWIAEAVGYRTAFLALGCFPLVSLTLWLAMASMLRPACAAVQNPGLRAGEPSNAGMT